jgi:hypothetical protein
MLPTGCASGAAPLWTRYVTIIDTIILNIHTNDAYLFDTYTS